jgi:hypothetical protein
VGNAFHAAFDVLVNVDEALTYTLTPNLQLDFGGNFGLNKVPPRAQLYAGLSQRF